MRDPSSTPTVVDVWQYIEPRFGGVGPAAAALANSVRAVSEWTFRQVAFCNPDESHHADGINADTLVLKISGMRPLLDRKVRNALVESIESCTLCHLHGVWQPHSLAVQSLAASLKRPVITSAHGMLEKWELAHKAWRKKVYSTLFERPALSRSACLRALSMEEANDYRRYGLTRPIAIVPNGVRALSRVDPSDLVARYPQIADKDVVLYLSRIHEKKGILNLLRSWPATVAAHKRAHLLIAGPEHAETATAARKIISGFNLSSSVTFAGTLMGSNKLAALSLARCFCLPSYSEGQSIAVLEALSIGLPVVITSACNVDGVAEAGAGFVGSNAPAQLTHSVVTILELNSSSWQEMGNCARNLAQTRFNWNNIGGRMQAVYQWMLGDAKPEYVID